MKGEKENEKGSDDGDAGVAGEAVARGRNKKERERGGGESERE